MTEVTGETNALFSLALQLLAGHPLAEFAGSFVALGLGFTFDHSVHSARKTFDQLTTFNKADRGAAKDAFLKAIEPIQLSDSSQSGEWTIVRMLYATGDEAAAREANAIAEKLRKNWPDWGSAPANEWRQTRSADPEAPEPINMADGLRRFRAISEDEIIQSMGRSIKDRDYRDFLPVACRFEPEVAVEKAHEILSGLLTRTGLPLRQLIFSYRNYAPLMTRDIAVRLIERITNSDMIDTCSEWNQDTLRMRLFQYIAFQLTPSEQLSCMINPAFGHSLLIDVIPSLKCQPVEAILTALKMALNAGDEEAIYGVLAAACYGNSPIASELESLIVRCRKMSHDFLRASFS